MAIPRVNRQPRQPQYPVAVDTGNPITRGLVRALVCEAAGIRDLMLGTGIAVTGTYIPQATESGYGRRNNTITRANYTLVDARTETVSAITIVWAGVVHRVGGTTYPFFRNQQTIVQATGSTGPLWSVRFGAATTVNSTTPIRVGAPTTYVYRKDGTIGSLFVDGVPALLNVTGGTTAHSASHGIDGNVGFAQSNDITTNVMLIYDRPLSDAESQSLSINPWQVFRPVQRRVYFDIVAGSGATTPVGNDLTGEYAIRSAVQSDSSGAYAVLGAVQADASSAYSVLGAVSADLPAEYNTLTSAQADIAASFTVRGSVQADAASSFAVRGSTQADAPATYLLRGSVSSDIGGTYDILNANSVSSSLAASYVVRGAVQSDVSGSYDLRTSVGAASEHAFMVRGLVSSDLASSYEVQAAANPVYADLAGSYAVDGIAPDFTRSIYWAAVPAEKFSAAAASKTFTASVPSEKFSASVPGGNQ